MLAVMAIYPVEVVICPLSWRAPELSAWVLASEILYLRRKDHGRTI